MTVTITCYGGVGQIGGNKLLVADGDAKVLLDFGAGFSDGDAYFNQNIRARKVNGAGDYFEFGLLPKLRGLYSEEALKNTDLKHEEPLVDAVLLSHFHYDHMGMIELLDSRIPVFCGETTAMMHEAYHSFKQSPLAGREVRTFRTGDRFRVGPIEVEPIHVDHSVPGAYGFILHTSGGTVAYTGDFRFHGPMGAMTEDFIGAASAARPAVLLSEGTRVSEERSKREMSEKEVVRETRRVLSGNRNLVFSSFRGNDIDRVSSFFKACEDTGRRLVVSMKVGAMLKKLEGDKRLRVPRLGKDVSVYVRRKKDGSYDDKDYMKWERQFLGDGVSAADIRKDQKGYLLHLDERQLPELIDIRPDRGGAYIHATTEAFNEEGEQDEAVVRNWVGHFGFSYHQIHASGHAPMNQVGELIRRIGADRVVPIHTEFPGLFPALVKGSVVAPERGKPIPI